MGKKIVVDSDILVAVSKQDDPSHEKAVILIRNLKKNKSMFYISNLVKQESATVISKHIGMEAARIFVTGLSSVIDQFIWVNDAIENAAWELFLKQNKKGTSFIDCANIAVMDYYKFDGILSFDRFYGKKLILN